MRRLLYIFAILLSGITAYAFDTVVILENSETGAKIIDLDVGAYDREFNNIAWPTLNMSDSTFVFIGLPGDQQVYIMYLVGGQFLGGTDVPEPKPEIKLTLPPSILPKTLKEVEVTARNIYMADNMTVLVPTERDKRISADGAALIRNMAVADLNVSPIDNTITTVSGDAVTTFIDYLPATDDDLRNIRSANVLRVETFENPSDPRFKGARHVVNFIMVKYEYGGYTKLFGNQSFINNAGNYSAYSKLGYRSMVYEASGGYNYSRTRHSGSNAVRHYMMPSGEVTLTNNTDESFNRSQGAFGFLKAVHQSENRVVSNIVGVTYSGKPESWTNNSELFDSPLYQSGMSHRRSTADNIALSWYGEYQFVLPAAFSLIFTPSASYADYKSDSYYKGGDDEIINDSRDKAWSLDLVANLSRRFGQHTLSLQGYYFHTSHNLDYLGTVPAEVFNHNNSGSVVLQAYFNLGRFTFIPKVTANFIRRNINDIITTEQSVRPFVQLMYQINNKNRLTIADFVQYMSVPANELGDNYLLTNQIAGTRGNPLLKNSGENALVVNYMWMPSNVFNLSAFANYQYMWKLLAAMYEPMVVDGREYMFSTTVNNGHQNVLNYGIAVGVHPVNGLSLRANLNARTAMIRSLTRYDGTELTYNIQATYSFSKFYLSAYYTSRSKFVDYNYISTTPQFYGLQAGWSNGNLNISATARNPFTSSYKGKVMTLDRDNYNVWTADYSNMFHRSFEVSLTYSFGYGKKKINRDNEAQSPGSVESGILR